MTLSLWSLYLPTLIVVPCSPPRSDSVCANIFFLLSLISSCFANVGYSSSHDTVACCPTLQHLIVFVVHFVRLLKQTFNFDLWLANNYNTQTSPPSISSRISNNKNMTISQGRGRGSPRDSSRGRGSHGSLSGLRGVGQFRGMPRGGGRGSPRGSP